MVGARGQKNLILTTLNCWKRPFWEQNYIENYFYLLKILKLLLKNVEEILFGWIFLGVLAGQTVLKHVWVSRWFDYKALLVSVKDRACLRIEIPAYCFNTFGLICGVLFYLLIKQLILGSKTIWQSMRKFSSAVCNVRAFLHMDKEEIFLSWKLHIGMFLFFR